MKFWELLSAFRTERTAIERVLSDSRWSTPYLAWLQDETAIVSSQCRDILDAFVPLELSRAVAAESAMTFELGVDGWLRKNPYRGLPATTLSALEIHDR